MLDLRFDCFKFFFYFIVGKLELRDISIGIKDFLRIFNVKREVCRHLF